MVASKVAAAVRIIVEIQQEGVAATQLAHSAMPNTTRELLIAKNSRVELSP